MRGASPQPRAAALAESGRPSAPARGQLVLSLPGHRAVSGGPVRGERRGLTLGLLALLASVLVTQRRGPGAAQSASPGLAGSGLPPVFCGL